MAHCSPLTHQTFTILRYILIALYKQHIAHILLNAKKKTNIWERCFRVYRRCCRCNSTQDVARHWHKAAIIVYTGAIARQVGLIELVRNPARMYPSSTIMYRLNFILYNVQTHIIKRHTANTHTHSANNGCDILCLRRVIARHKSGERAQAVHNIDKWLYVDMVLWGRIRLNMLYVVIYCALRARKAQWLMRAMI